MKERIKETVCALVLLLDFLAFIGFVGAHELNRITTAEMFIKVGVCMTVMCIVHLITREKINT